ncbi:MAG: galactokinase [Spirochaetota bacterium]
MKDYSAAHEAEYGETAEIVVSAPGGIDLMGSHTEVSGGPVLRLSVPRRMWVVLSRRKDSSLRFFAADYDERKRTNISNLKYRREDRWANVLKGAVAEVLAVEAGITGINLTVGGTVPQNSGLSGSAALLMAALVGMRALYEADLSDQELWLCGKRAKSRFSQAGGGVAPFMSAQIARPGHGLLYDDRFQEPQHIPIELGTAVLAVTVAGVPQLPTESTFRSRFEECRRGLAALTRHHSGTALRDFRVSDINEQMGRVPETVRRRCIHVVEEGARVGEMARALLHGNVTTAGKLLTHSHISLRDQYEVSCPEVDWLVKHATQIDGVYGTRIAGGGFGGSTVSLLERDSLDAYHGLLERYHRIFGFRTETFLASPTDGIDVQWRENARTADQR